MDPKIVIKIHKEYRKELVNYFSSRLKNQTTSIDPEDLTQDLFIRLIEVKDESKMDTLRPFLYTIALNMVRDLFRRNKHKLEKATISDDVLVEDTDISSSACGVTGHQVRRKHYGPDMPLQWSQQLKQIKELIKSFSEIQKDAFWFRYFHGYSNKEIAACLQVTVSAVEKHLSSTYELLEREGLRNRSKYKTRIRDKDNGR